MQINELFDQAMDEMRGAWRFRWLGLVAAWAVCLIGWFAVYSIPDTYEANARVYVDSKGILRPLLQGLAIDPDVASGLDLVRQVLLSRPQIERVARDTGLDALARTPEQKEELIRDIQSRIDIAAADLRARTTSGEGLYRISFQDADRKKSVEVVETMLKGFVENALGGKRSDQESAQRFIDEQVAVYESKLKASEAALSDFKKRNVGVMPSSQGDYFAKLQVEIAGVDTVDQQLKVAESRRGEIQRQLNGEEPVIFGIDSGSSAAAANAGGGDVAFRIQDREKYLEELLVRYTDKHPEVVATRAAIDELKKKRDDELARVSKGQAATGSLASSLKSNPVYQGLELDLNRTKVQIAELREELKQRQSRVASLRGKVNIVPEVEAELTSLTRNYEGDRQRYQELVQRSETASLSESADRSGSVKYDVIEPPSADLEPISPNRPRLLAVVLVLGLALAGGVAWLMNQLNPVFHSIKKLESVTGLLVLSAVSRTWLARHRRTRRAELLKFATATALLVVTFGVVLALQHAGAQQLRQLIG